MTSLGFGHCICRWEGTSRSRHKVGGEFLFERMLIASPADEGYHLMVAQIDIEELSRREMVTGYIFLSTVAAWVEGEEGGEH